MRVVVRVVGGRQTAQICARALRVYARAQETRVAIELHHVEYLLLCLVRNILH